jgi:hypothetical protein
MPELTPEPDSTDGKNQIKKVNISGPNFEQNISSFFDSFLLIF